ncbi:hypothetical protein [Methylobacterium sp. E-005]|nr:hypothetical protein [Methylobacterium sp. E-005]
MDAIHRRLFRQSDSRPSTLEAKLRQTDEQIPVDNHVGGGLIGCL